MTGDAPPVRHAWPFRMIDRAAPRDGTSCVVLKLLSADETLGRPETAADPARIPGFLLIEALVQAALPLAAPAPAPPGAEGAAAGAAVAGAAPGMLVAIHSARVLRSACPGDVLTMTARVTARLGGMIRVASRAELSGGAGVIAQGEFTIATAGGGAAA